MKKQDNARSIKILYVLDAYKDCNVGSSLISVYQKNIAQRWRKWYNVSIKTGGWMSDIVCGYSVRI